MTITASLLITFTTMLILGGWRLAVAISRADEGYEDALGFSPGKLPPLPLSLLQPKAAQAPVNAPARMSVPAASHSSTDTTAQSVTIFVSGAGRAASPLYRRHRRSGNTATPFPVQSASPFEIQCAATRARANQADSTPPMPLSAKSAFSDPSAP